ncbi:glycoside hydrolase family 27 protein [Williamsia sp. MIQD14]|uniref:glycoside hydrolase family 27 protein n=1 Tax=Williamsia sp. MIQD14 TaxID=3425703 RepID=UPI003DA0170C
MTTHRTRRAVSTALMSAAVLSGCATALPHDLGGAEPAIAGVATTPPMGWNSWNTFGCDIDETTIRAQADALISSGLAAAGYRYVVVDDCWYTPTRDAGGRLTASSTRFPSGMAALGAYLHARGLAFGIYAGASDRTCAQLSGTYPGATGSRGHETTDAATFASWGVDYVKYDWCSSESDTNDQRRAFVAMRDAIRATGRPMVYSINPNSGIGLPAEAGAAAVPGAAYDWGGVATMTRLTNDITAQWSTAAGVAGYQGVLDIAAASASASAEVRAGRWLDLDMLEIGVGTTLTEAQQRSHLALWAMAGSPLIAGNDLTRMGSATRSLLASPGILAVDQDPSAAARAVSVDGWTRTRRMSDGSTVVSITNPSADARTVVIDRTVIGTQGSVTDLWTGRQIADAGAPVRVTVAGGDTAVMRFR